MSVQTLAPGNMATVSVTPIDETPFAVFAEPEAPTRWAFEFGIPQGFTGTDSTVEINPTVDKLPCDAAPYVVNSGEPGRCVLKFALPQGFTGEPGPPAITNVADGTLGATVGSVMEYRAGNVLLSLQRVSTADAGVRLYLQSALEGQSILADARRISGYNASPAAGGLSWQTQGLDNALLTNTPLNFDDTIYTSSNEFYCLLLRQQDPDTLLWSLTQIKIFMSHTAQRVSIWSQKISENTSY